MNTARVMREHSMRKVEVLREYLEGKGIFQDVSFKLVGSYGERQGGQFFLER